MLELVLAAECCLAATFPKALPMYFGMHLSNNDTENRTGFGLIYHAIHTNWAQQQWVDDRASYNHIYIYIMIWGEVLFFYIELVAYWGFSLLKV